MYRPYKLYDIVKVMPGNYKVVSHPEINARITYVNDEKGLIVGLNQTEHNGLVCNVIIEQQCVEVQSGKIIRRYE